jgi:hypothetical protein
MAEKDASFKFWEPEKNITQEYRQQLFDRQVTQDDHLMHIVGILDEAHTGVYYVVKNSWGEIYDGKGYVNVSEAYMRQNTISFTVHKDALPEDTRIRLGLQAGEVIIPKGSTGATDTKDQPTKPTRMNPRFKTLPAEEGPKPNASKQMPKQ